VQRARPIPRAGRLGARAIAQGEPPEGARRGAARTPYDYPAHAPARSGYGSNRSRMPRQERDRKARLSACAVARTPTRSATRSTVSQMTLWWLRSAGAGTEVSFRLRHK
jgi:hypothetical protein